MPPQIRPSNPALSFLDRAADDVRRSETELLGRWVAGHLIGEGTHLWVTSGTTICRTAVCILEKVRKVHVTTNSVPVAWEFMQLMEKGKLATYATVSVVGGEVRPVTGAIASKQMIDDSTTLLYSPHGLVEKAIVGNRDIDQIKPLVDAHRRVIMPISWQKLGNPGNEVIKYYGHWKRVECDLVLTKEPLEGLGLSGERIDKARHILDLIKKALGSRLRIHWV